MIFDVNVTLELLLEDLRECKIWQVQLDNVRIHVDIFNPPADAQRWTPSGERFEDT
jgi:hypothetical protein